MAQIFCVTVQRVITCLSQLSRQRRRLPAEKPLVALSAGTRFSLGLDPYGARHRLSSALFLRAARCRYNRVSMPFLEVVEAEGHLIDFHIMRSEERPCRGIAY